MVPETTAPGNRTFGSGEPNPPAPGNRTHLRKPLTERRGEERHKRTEEIKRTGNVKRREKETEILRERERQRHRETERERGVSGNTIWYHVHMEAQKNKVI